MLLWHIFTVKPLAALAVVLCLATILTCFLLERRRPQQPADRFLIGVLGLLSVYQGIRILQSVGLLSISIGTTLDDVIDLTVAAFYLIGAFMMRLSTINRLDAESAIRLAHAAPPRSSRQLESSRDSTLETIGWALPRLSDGAFKLYAFLCLHGGNNHVHVGVQDIRQQLGKTKDELDNFLAELQNAGAVSVRREGHSLNIELLSQHRRTPPPPSEDVSRTSVTLPA